MGSKTILFRKQQTPGYLNVSSPELTALDLLAYVDKIGMNTSCYYFTRVSSSNENNSTL